MRRFRARRGRRFYIAACTGWRGDNFGRNSTHWPMTSYTVIDSATGREMQTFTPAQIRGVSFGRERMQQKALERARARKYELEACYGAGAER